MTSIQDELATLTPDERSSAPREWCPNGSGMMVRVISPAYLRARIASRELDRRGEDLPDQVYRAAVKAMTVPCCHRATMTIRAHVMTIAAAHGFTFKEITARNRLTEISVARQEIMWTLRHVHGLTFPQIAAYVNRSDHTTVVHGVSMHQKRLDGQVGQPRKALSHDAVHDLTEQGWSIAAIARHLRVSRLRVASTRAKAA